MSHFDQVLASFSRSMRIFLRDKAIFGSSLFVPIFFLIMLPQVLFYNVQPEVMPILKGYLTVAMITLLIMTTGMSNLAGSIAADRDHDLYSKLSSMPVSVWSESIGRILTVMVFSSMGSVILLVLGLLTGAELSFVLTDSVLVLGTGVAIILTSVGIGFIITSLVRSESAASHVGVAIVLANYFIGIAVPYSDLPDGLKSFAQFNPLSAGNNMMTSLVVGSDIVGYDPWIMFNVIVMVCLCSAFIIVGLLLYSRICWRN